MFNYKQMGQVFACWISPFAECYVVFSTVNNIQYGVTSVEMHHSTLFHARFAADINAIL